MPDVRWRHEIERCRREITLAEGALRSGHPDVQGLCLALADWSAELRIILEEERRQVRDPAAEV
jgi:hypothetical protein